MTHDHNHGHSHSHSGESSQALTRALLITSVFMVVELVGGYFANSLALISDAAHMLTDMGALLLSLFVIWLAKRPATPTMSFGYHRVEILGALGSGLSIWVISGFLVYEAIRRMANPPEVQGLLVFVIAAFGLGANLMSMRALHHASDRSMNVKAAYLHVVADSLGSVGAVVAGLVLWMTGWRPIDPIITFIFAGLMLFSSWDLVRDAVAVLMESTPTSVDPEKIRKDLTQIEGVHEVHDLHIWTVASGKMALSVHLVSPDSEGALNKAHEVLQKHFGIIHTTIQVEHPDKFSSDRCYDCATT